MQVTLYKHVSGLYFDNPAKLILFNNKSTYDQDYTRYISRASFWTGEGKTYNIELLEVLEIPLTAITTADPVYVKTAINGLVKYYYVNSIERVQQKAQLTLTLDVFATYYERADIAAGSLIVKQSTAKVADRLIPLTEESTPIPKGSLTKQWLPSYTGHLRFLLKLKCQSAKSPSTEAYSTIYAAVEVHNGSGLFPSYAVTELMYDHVCNVFEIESNVAGIGLAAEVEEIYLLPDDWIPVGSKIAYLHYVNRETAKVEKLRFFRVEKVRPTSYVLKNITAAYNKIIIGENVIELPAYYAADYPPKGRITVEPVYNASNFDILLKYETNDPVSIKNFFQCQVSKSTQETSLQKIARIAGYIMTGTNAVQQAVIQGGTSIATGNPLGFFAAGNTLKSAQDSITANLISVATKTKLSATSYESQAINVFYDAHGNKRDGFIYQEYYAGEDSQGLLNLKRFGLAWYNAVENLEALLTLPKLVEGARLYVEAEAELSGIPLEAAQEITTLLANGVELIEG